MPCSSHSRRISSATPMAGWVSFRWMATLSARVSSRPCSRRCRATMSWIDALVKKYSWRSRSSRPAGVLSFGYSTQEMFSNSFFTSAARA